MQGPFEDGAQHIHAVGRATVRRTLARGLSSASCHNLVLCRNTCTLHAFAEIPRVSPYSRAAGSSGTLTAAGMCCGMCALTGWCHCQRAALMRPGRWSAAITVSCALLLHTTKTSPDACRTSYCCTCWASLLLPTNQAGHSLAMAHVQRSHRAGIPQTPGLALSPIRARRSKTCSGSSSHRWPAAQLLTQTTSQSFRRLR